MKTKRQISEKWEAFVKNLQSETSLPFESPAEKLKRIKDLESDPANWMKFYFHRYASADFAPFHKKSIKRFLKHLTWYETRAWSRELAKSTILMMQVFFAIFVQKSIRNLLHVSNSYDNSEDLITPYKLTLEYNTRLINDYGEQKSLLKWEAGNFKTKSGVSFRAIGWKQSPRGKKNEEARPDCVIIDDIDTDESCRNPKIVDEKWKWIERALIPALSVSGNKRIYFNGNIIAKHCVIKNAIEKSDYSEVINIRDKHGKSSWPQKNKESDIDYMLSKISFASGQQEYFNTPITEGTVFKDLTFGKVPSLKTISFVSRYGDPAPSDREAKSGSTKAVVDVCVKNGVYYIVRVRLDRTTNYRFVEWYHELNEHTVGRTLTYNYMENNSLQDPYYQDVYKPLIKKVNKTKEVELLILPDARKKPPKFTRMEANLEPLNRFGKLIFNIAEKDNPHMKRLIEQFEAIEPGLSSPSDGVDAVEGAIWILNKKTREMAPLKSGSHQRSKSKHF